MFPEYSLVPFTPKSLYKGWWAFEYFLKHDVCQWGWNTRETKLCINWVPFYQWPLCICKTYYKAGVLFPLSNAFIMQSVEGLYQFNKVCVLIFTRHINFFKSLSFEQDCGYPLVAFIHRHTRDVHINAV